MNDSRRIKGRNVVIDYDATRAFFESRGQREYSNVLSATMYQDHDAKLVEQRDLAEKAAVVGILDLGNTHRVLDVGCGVGRWAWLLAQRCEGLQYLGLDFSASLIEKARAESAIRQLENVHFQVMSATDIQPQAMLLQGAFDLALISGLLIYLNDNDCVKVLRDTAQLCKPGGALYLREPVGVAERFTLDRFYSEELSDEYSAIYRTVDELHALMATAFAGIGMTVEREQLLFPQDLEKRTETRQYFFVLRRDEGVV
ncbi:methyltransferase domain-containing protein [Pseudomonas sp. NY5710]|uniref:class I SAM-dependent methyltransferase n=1 Tax=Pseudomonas sp. NY5710 TaxID=2662033 RepID=UPI00156DBDBB|nr:class I SAM-dependent methyltransferase [Pseudomonas sp. NY5710]QKL01327.1 methyltransferase domain-containing protein [Pseudomonas sp. NY5710]